MSEKQSGGVNVKGGSVNAGRDIVGRDKIEVPDHIYLEESGMEEKSGCLFAMERIVVFSFFLFISGSVLTVMLGGIGWLVGQAVPGESVESIPLGAICGGVVGLLMAIGLSILATSNVSRYKKR